LAYCKLGNNCAQWLQWEMFGATLYNQTHLLGILKTRYIGEIQLPMMFTSNVVDAEYFSSACQQHQHLVKTKRVSHKSSTLRIRRWWAQSNDMKEQAFDLKRLCGDSTHKGTDNIAYQIKNLGKLQLKNTTFK